MSDSPTRRHGTDYDTLRGLSADAGRTSPRQAEDPLAELARLVSQGQPSRPTYGTAGEPRVNFGQPARADACECERGTDSTLEQALQLIGGRTLHGKVIAPGNRIGTLLGSGADDETLVEQLFLATLSRHPGPQERQLAVSALAERPSDRRQAAEDLLWTLLNHPEFLFQH